MTTLYQRINIEDRDGVNHIFDSKVFEVGDMVELEPMRINTKNPCGACFSTNDSSHSERIDKQFIVIERREIKIFEKDPVISFVLRDKPSTRITNEYNVVRIDDPSIWINNVRFNYIRIDSYKELIFETKES